MTREILFASELDRVPDEGILFRVAEVNVARALVGGDPDGDGWSLPVQFRFQWRDDRTYDLVLRRYKGWAS